LSFSTAHISYQYMYSPAAIGQMDSGLELRALIDVYKVIYAILPAALDLCILPHKNQEQLVLWSQLMVHSLLNAVQLFLSHHRSLYVQTLY
jgi:hypothetical protein